MRKQKHSQVVSESSGLVCVCAGARACVCVHPTGVRQINDTLPSHVPKTSTHDKYLDNANLAQKQYVAPH